MKLGAESKELLLYLLSDGVVNAVGLIPSSVEGVELWLRTMDEARRRRSPAVWPSGCNNFATRPVGSGKPELKTRGTHDGHLRPSIKRLQTTSGIAHDRCPPEVNSNKSRKLVVAYCK